MTIVAQIDCTIIAHTSIHKIPTEALSNYPSTPQSWSMRMQEPLCRRYVIIDGHCKSLQPQHGYPASHDDIQMSQ